MLNTIYGVLPSSYIPYIKSYVLGSKLPFKHVSNSSSLARLGFKGKSAGLAGRPLMLCASLTMHHKVQYLMTRIGDDKSAHLPLVQIDTSHVLQLVQHVEPSSEMRYRRYLAIMKRRRR